MDSKDWIDACAALEVVAALLEVRRCRSAGHSHQEGCRLHLLDLDLEPEQAAELEPAEELAPKLAAALEAAVRLPCCPSHL